MPPLTSTAPWSVVAARNRRQPLPQPPSAAHDDPYLKLRISKLMFKNKHFPSDLRLPIQELASTMNTALTLIHGGRTCLRFAFQLATQDQTPLCDGLVDDILHLCDLLARSYATPDGARWIRETLRDATAPHRPDRTASSGSDSSTAPGQRRREDPSSGRGNSKRTTLSRNSDSDRHPPPRRTGHDRRSNRQVPPRVYHAAEHDDSDAPPFLPRTLRRREHAQHLPSGIAETWRESRPRRRFAPLYAAYS